MKRSTLALLLAIALSPLSAGNNHHQPHHPSHPQPQPSPTPAPAPQVNQVTNNYESCCTDCHQKTKYIGEVGVRLFDSKLMNFQVFDAYNFRDNHNDMIGARLNFKVGKSYEEKMIEELRKIQIELMSVAHRPGIHQENYYPEKAIYLYDKDTKERIVVE